MAFVIFYFLFMLFTVFSALKYMPHAVLKLLENMLRNASRMVGRLNREIAVLSR